MQESNIRRSCNNSEDARRWCHAMLSRCVTVTYRAVPSYPSVAVACRIDIRPCTNRVKPCRTVSNRVGPCQTRVGPCQTVLDRVKSVSDRVWVKFDPAGVKGLNTFQVNLGSMFNKEFVYLLKLISPVDELWAGSWSPGSTGTSDSFCTISFSTQDVCHSNT